MTDEQAKEFAAWFASEFDFATHSEIPIREKLEMAFHAGALWMRDHIKGLLNG